MSSPRSLDASGYAVEQLDLLQIFGRDRQRDRVADRLVESVVGAVPEDHRQAVIGALIEVVAELVMDRREVLGRLVDAHLDAEVVRQVDIPGARVTDHLAILRLGEHRALPEGLRQRRESQRDIEVLAGANHVEGGHVPPLEDVGQ